MDVDAGLREPERGDGPSVSAADDECGDLCAGFDDRLARGVGAALLDALIASTEAAGIWTIQSGVFPENTASLALHRRAGFRVIGVRERIGRHHGVWRDVMLIERRSPVVG